MENERQKIEWVIGFVGLDFETLRPGDKLNLLSELHDFFDFPYSAKIVAGPTGLPLRESRETELRRFWKDLQRLQGSIQDLLNGLVETRQAYGVSIPQAKIKNVTLSPHSAPGKPEGQIALFLSAPWRDAFLMTLVLRLWQVGIANVRRCPECKTIFLRHHRQLFCSRACTNKANFREWAKENRPGKKKRPGGPNVRVGRG